MLESGESVPAEIQVKTEEFNDLLREAQVRIRRARAIESQLAYSKSPEASRKIIRPVHEIILGYAGEMVLAGQSKDAGPSASTSGSSQYPRMPLVKDGANPLPITGGPTQEPMREFRFHPGRRWRFHFAWPRRKIVVEVDGGIYSRGRHVRGAGFERDAEKRNAAVMGGWRVLHFTPRQVRSGQAVQAIEALLKTVH